MEEEKERLQLEKNEILSKAESRSNFSRGMRRGKKKKKRTNTSNAGYGAKDADEVDDLNLRDAIYGPEMKYYKQDKPSFQGAGTQYGSDKPAVATVTQLNTPGGTSINISNKDPEDRK